MTDPIDRLLIELARLTDPAAKLRRVAAVGIELVEWNDRYAGIRAETIREAREETTGRLTWREIGEIFGVSLQRAHELGNQPERIHQ